MFYIQEYLCEIIFCNCKRFIFAFLYLIFYSTFLFCNSLLKVITVRGIIKCSFINVAFRIIANFIHIVTICPFDIEF